MNNYLLKGKFMRNILISSFVAVLFLTGCLEEKTKESSNTTSSLSSSEQSSNAKEDLLNKIKESSSNITTKVTEASKEIGKIVADTSKEISSEASTVASQIVDKSDDITKQVTTEVKKSADKIEETIDNIMKNSDSSSEGKQLFLKCAGCHGQNGEKPALGKSLVIQGWDKQKTIDALNGYKNDTYGSVMKGVMKSQVLSLNDSEIEALAEYISTLK